MGSPEESINKGFAQSEKGKLKPQNKVIKELRKKYQKSREKLKL